MHGHHHFGLLRAFSTGLSFVLGVLVLPMAYGYTFRQVGVESNFLVENGRVVFLQADGSLTVLALESGDVLLRERSQYYSGNLLRVRQGVLMLNYGRIALLDPVRFQTVWETTAHYEPCVTEETVVSYDGNGLVECRALADGRIRWRYSLPGALELAVVGGRVLVHRAAIFEREEAKPMTVLLDLATGTELLSRTPPHGRLWVHVYLDRTNLYALAADYQQKRSEYVYATMERWNLLGEKENAVPISAAEAKGLRFHDRVFEFDGKTFMVARVYANARSMPPEERTVRRYRPQMLDLAVTGTNGLGYDLGDGFALIERESRLANGRVTELELRTPQRQWKGVLEYLRRSGHLTQVAREGGKFLLGTSVGQVECIDAADGHSRWLYVFPTLRHTMSYSSHGMPPMMASAAEDYYRENSSKPSVGFRTDGDSGATRVVLDPAPYDPFVRLPLYLACTWTSSLLALLLLPILHLNRRICQGDARRLAGVTVLLSVLAVVCFLALGRVSVGSSIALRLAILAGLVFLLKDTKRCHQAGARGWSIGLSIALGVLGGVALPAVLSF